MVTKQQIKDVLVSISDDDFDIICNYVLDRNYLSHKTRLIHADDIADYHVLCGKIQCIQELKGIRKGALNE